MNPEHLQKIIEAEAETHIMYHEEPISRVGLGIQIFKAGASFALPLGEERGFRLAIEALKNKGRHVIQDKDVFNWLEQEGKRLGILK